MHSASATRQGRTAKDAFIRTTQVSLIDILRALKSFWQWIVVLTNKRGCGERMGVFGCMGARAGVDLRRIRRLVEVPQRGLCFDGVLDSVAGFARIDADLVTARLHFCADIAPMPGAFRAKHIGYAPAQVWRRIGYWRTRARYSLVRKLPSPA